MRRWSLLFSGFWGFGFGVTKNTPFSNKLTTQKSKILHNILTILKKNTIYKY